MKLYVIMANDFPQGVMDNEAQAVALVKSRNDLQTERRRENFGQVTPFVFWRVYDFELNKVGAP